jgi:hypothetical protein
MFGFEFAGNQSLKIGFEDIPAKIHSTLIHHLKYKSGIDWAFSKNTTNKILRRKFDSIEKFIRELDEKETKFPMRLEVTVKQNSIQNKI